MDREVLLFDKTAFDCCRSVVKNYSTSFFLGIQFLQPEYRDPIYAIYAFLRYGDEIVDTFLLEDRETLLKKFVSDTYEAINAKLSFNPVLHAFQLVVNEHKIERKLIEAFFRSMEMDLNIGARYEKVDYDNYIYGSAEIVGLMCCRVLCDDDLYDELQVPIKKLGSALQKVNFLRDMKSDFEDRGRCYFPGMYYADFDEALKRKIEEDIESEFDVAYSGILRLPEHARSGIEVTYLVYRRLFDKIKTISAESLLRDGRVSQSKWFLLFTNKFFYFWINMMVMLSVTIYASCFGPSYFYKVKEIAGAIFVSASLFIYWDQWFARKKVWSFNYKYVIGFRSFGLPIEECLFFVSVPYACMFIHEFVKEKFPPHLIDDSTAQNVYCFLIIAISLFGLLNYKRLYTRITSLAAIASLAFHYYLFQFELFDRVLIGLTLHYFPFLIVNGILTGALGEPVVLYDENQICNVRIHTIPVEDSVFSLAWYFTYVSVFEYLQLCL